MCRRATCSQCNKPTFAGCGAHIEQVLADVPKPDRCTCREKKATSNTAGQAKSDSWLSSWLSK